jgi:hypothetical protein
LAGVYKWLNRELERGEKRGEIGEWSDRSNNYYFKTKGDLAA